MRIRLGHVVFAMIIASILNLAIAWLCVYYTWPGYNGAIVISADKFDNGAEIIKERYHDLAVTKWIAFGLTELDGLGPWYFWDLEYELEDWTPSILADSLDAIINENAPSKNSLEQNDLRYQLNQFWYRNAKLHKRIDAGWPMRSFQGFVSGGWLDPKDPRKLFPPQSLRAFTVERQLKNITITRYLPYRPIWLGLILNTLLYAIVILTTMWLLLATRAKLRIRRNLCPNCKYPIGVSEVCTECGHNLMSCVAKPL